MWTWMSPYHITATVLLNKPLEVAYNSWYLPILRGNRQHTFGIIIPRIAGTSPGANKSKVWACQDFIPIWMCIIWMSPHSITSSLADHTFGSCLEFWVPPKGPTLTTA
jgi:hypothetical protein